MLLAQPDKGPTRLPWVLLQTVTAVALILCAASCPPATAQAPEILPLSEVRPGMKGYAYTIFAGDQAEKFDLEVIGVMPNFLGPKQSVILIQLLGPKVERTGVVAGMSGSPVYLEGKLAGALSLRLGIFTKAAIAVVTPIEAVRVYLCGHLFLHLCSVSLPMARSHVLMTLSSSLASTKIVNVVGPIGTISSDHLPAVTGKLGAPPPLIPLDLTVAANGAEKKLHFEVVSHPKLTPLLMAMSTFSGLTLNSLYGEGTTLHVQGEIRLKRHSLVRLENSYAPGDTLNPDGFPVAIGVQSIFARLFANTFERPDIEGIQLRIESMPGRKSYTIESAWLEKGEAQPGEKIRVRILLRPYRGETRVEEMTVRVPEQAARGATLHVLVSDADWLNRASRGFAFGGGAADGGLEQLISLINKERRNDRVYAGLFLPAPTLLWADKEMPNVPLSQINVLDGRPNPGSVQVLRESLASEDSVALGGPVTGVISLNLSVR